MSFEQITIIIALIMLIICFVVVVVMIYNSKGVRAFPARMNRCPDLYRLNQDECTPISGGSQSVNALVKDPTVNDICDYKKKTFR